MGDRNPTTMRILATTLAVLLLSVSALTQSATPERPQAEAGQPELESLYFTAERMENLSIFFRAVKTAGLTDTLKGPGPFTVFAPTDEAFAKLPAETLEELLLPQNKERLRDILISHIFPVGATSGEITKLNEAVTLKRKALPVEAGSGIKVGGASVTRADIMATNGVLHLVDTVLMPQGDN
jgi:uncharacterized surface protein with fasciclin (FAS1) repeats